ERMNQTIERQLRKFLSDKKKRWIDYIPQIQRSYRETVHAVTKKTPYELMFGRKPNSEHLQVPSLEEITPTEEEAIKHLQNISHTNLEIVERLTSNASKMIENAAKKGNVKLPEVGDLVHIIRYLDPKKRKSDKLAS